MKKSVYESKDVPLEKITIRGDFVLVKQDEDIAKSKGGILLPDESKRKPYRGQIVKVGNGFYNTEGKLIKLDEFSVGDYVLYERYTGREFVICGDEYILLSTRLIIAQSKYSFKDSDHPFQSVVMPDEENMVAY